MDLPKTLPCRKCGVKPKQKIVAFGFTDKDDEFFLVHKCGGVMKYFPLRGTFDYKTLDGQIPLVITEWNRIQCDEKKSGE